MVKIGGLQKSSLIDYPEKISAIIFTQGCNFRCPYCHNPEIITVNGERETVNEEYFFEFLESRKGKLDGVVITGGEPTLQKDLPQFIERIKSMNFDVKLDTNGSNPKMLIELINKYLINYVAMDIKAPIKKYSEITNSKVNTSDILKSINTLKAATIPFEFRTTVVKTQLAISDFEQMGKMIAGAEKYYLQKFVPTKTLNPDFINEKTYSDEEFTQIITLLKKYVKQVELR